MALALDVMDRPWKWGEADCVLSACDVFHRLYGIDPARGFRGTYGSALQAARVIRRMGGPESAAEAVAASCGLAAGKGAPGELGLIPVSGCRMMLTICVAPRQWAGKTETGMTTLPEVVRCWRA